MPLNQKLTLFTLKYKVIDAEHSIIGYCDAELSYCYANDAHWYWFGKMPDQIVGKMSLQNLLGPFLYGTSREYIDRVLLGRLQEFECLVVLPSGEVKKVRTKYVPDIEDGIVIGFFIYSFDVRRSDILVNQNKLQPLSNENAYDHSSVDYILEAVLRALRASILTGFPGIVKLAKRYFISETKLKTEFKKAYHTTIFIYYRNLQMEVAHDYISRRLANKGQMAMKFNFSNPSNFSACYKRFLREKEQQAEEEVNSLNPQNAINPGQYVKFIEELPTAAAVVNADFVFLGASQLWYSVFKLGTCDIKGKSLFDISPDLKVMYKKVFTECLNKTVTHLEEECLEKVDGSYGWLRWDIKPWYQSKGKVGGLLIFATDISSFKINTGKAKYFNHLNAS
ncbi:PAS domain-containing protein [Mucilaginibacter xinganensis]|uniref:PAS fold protein n=1 Tax=Mucilaginibacter xinganensis TaxID=1234841 RepID=A0A223P3X1_9SPHI|nr:PAS domain-containing protein [Mucilaginibacter xinganensis]ASU36548.1 PAS fold protein [Mucilaginibacter xinganensis]